MPTNLFKKGFDPRRYRGGAQPGPVAKEKKKRREADKKARENAEKDTTMPLDYMLRRMRNPDLLEHERFAAAWRAAPYVHPQLQAIAHQHMSHRNDP
jgi:hypothetical protein